MATKKNSTYTTKPDRVTTLEGLEPENGAIVNLNGVLMLGDGTTFNAIGGGDGLIAVYDCFINLSSLSTAEIVYLKDGNTITVTPFTGAINITLDSDTHYVLGIWSEREDVPGVGLSIQDAPTLLASAFAAGNHYGYLFLFKIPNPA